MNSAFVIELIIARNPLLGWFGNDVGYLWYQFEVATFVEVVNLDGTFTFDLYETNDRHAIGNSKFLDNWG